MTAALCGCGGKYPELTDDDEQAILKYAATLLYENDQNRDSRLMTEDEMILAMQRRAAHAYMPEPEPTKAPEQDSDGEHADGRIEDDLIGGGEVVETRTLAEFFGLPGIDISYQGYFFTKSYPEDSEDDFYFAMDALYGNELLILQYTITNQNAQAAQVNILDIKPRFRVFINDGAQINALTTLLLDDMKTTNCTLEPGESRAVVVVFEVTEAEAASMQQLRLTVKTEEDSWTVELLGSGAVADSSWEFLLEDDQTESGEGLQRADGNIVGVSNKNIMDIGSDYSDTVMNDVTGRWRCLLIAEDNFDITEYALSCYQNYFDSDADVLAVINYTTKTITSISRPADYLYVSVYEYVDGEEYDASNMFGGVNLGNFFVYFDNGDIERLDG